MNYERTYSGNRQGTFFVGVAPDNVSDLKYEFLNSAKRQAEEWSEETGIKFSVYEQVMIYRPVS